MLLLSRGATFLRGTPLLFRRAGMIPRTSMSKEAKGRKGPTGRRLIGAEGYRYFFSERSELLEERCAFDRFAVRFAVDAAE